jgi:hypothetical protein
LGLMAPSSDADASYAIPVRQASALPWASFPRVTGHLKIRHLWSPENRPLGEENERCDCLDLSQDSVAGFGSGSGAAGMRSLRR